VTKRPNSTQHKGETGQHTTHAKQRHHTELDLTSRSGHARLPVNQTAPSGHTSRHDTSRNPTARPDLTGLRVTPRQDETPRRDTKRPNDTPRLSTQRQNKTKTKEKKRRSHPEGEGWDGYRRGGYGGGTYREGDHGGDPQLEPTPNSPKTAQIGPPNHQRVRRPTGPTPTQPQRKIEPSNEKWETRRGGESGYEIKLAG